MVNSYAVAQEEPREIFMYRTRTVGSESTSTIVPMSVAISAIYNALSVTNVRLKIGPTTGDSCFSFEESGIKKEFETDSEYEVIQKLREKTDTFFRHLVIQDFDHSENRVWLDRPTRVYPITYSHSILSVEHYFPPGR